MSVSISHIIRNDFKDMHDLKACKAYVMRAAFMLQTQLHDDVCVRRDDIAWKDIEKYGWKETLTFAPDGTYPPEFSIRMNRYEVRIFLRHGFWQIDSFYHYHAITSVVNGRLWLRDTISDIARTLGVKEIWHADEFHVDNVPDDKISIYDATFDEWLSFALESGITELDTQYWLSRSEFEYPPAILHDDITDLDEHLEHIRKHWPNYNVFGLFTKDQKIVGLRNNKLYWLDNKTSRAKYLAERDFKNIDFRSVIKEDDL